ncbi:hypothetical protein [Maricaulis sp.]|uniref:hypothetical protein n=1 Tax=Maricaulis sp. TaxID=1486257 RepID=UPI002B277E49|nr:hypothetical protein [Maricaulis sp.]
MISDPGGPAPCEVRVDAGLGLVEFNWTGPVNLGTVLAAYDRAAAHPDWRPNFNRLSVYADDLPGSDLDFDTVQSIRQGLDAWQATNAPGQHVRAASVVASPFNGVLAAVWQALSRDSDGVTVEVFRSRGAALDWLVAGSSDTPVRS